MRCFPGIQTFWVSEEITQFFAGRLDDRIRDGSAVPIAESSTVQGAPTPDVLTRADTEMTAKLAVIQQMLERATAMTFAYSWVQLNRDAPGGFQGVRNQAHGEDYSFLLYLSSCESVATRFFLNPHPDMELTIESLPRKNRLVLFLSQIPHEDNVADAGKAVLAGGLRITGLLGPNAGWRLGARRETGLELDDELIVAVNRGVTISSSTTYAEGGVSRTLACANPRGDLFQATAGTLAILDAIDGRRTVRELLDEVRQGGARYSEAAITNLLRNLAAADIVRVVGQGEASAR